MIRVRVPSALPSLTIAAAAALVIVAQSAFTFSAILESQRLSQTISFRDGVEAQIAAMETDLYRQRASRRAAAYAVRLRVARLLPLVPAERAEQLKRIEAEAAAYERISMRGGPSAQARYDALTSHVSWIVRDFAQRTRELNAEGLRREAVWKNAAAAVLPLGLVLVSALLGLLEYYRRKAERALAQRVHSLQEALRTDALTALPNERAFHEDLARYPSSARVALMLLDVDDFKAVNEGRGRDYGDRLIETFAAALKRTRNHASLYRIYGDRFALLWKQPVNASVRAKAENAWRTSAKSLRGITVSSGYCEASLAELEAPLIESAEAALRSAKQKGGDTFVDLRDVQTGVSVLSRAKAQALRNILSDARMPMYFQPIVDTVTGRTLAYEALARPGTEYGLHGPEEMFDIAERLYRNFELDDLCVRSALRSAEARPGVLLFLNVVPASLESDRLDIDRCMLDMARAGCGPEQIVLELTERKIGNVNTLTRRMEELRSRGFRLALDDTGAGYAGLDLLSKLSFDFVKIDRSLIVRAMDDRRARGVLSGVLAIAQETGSTVIAEGIETADMFAFARQFHVRSVRKAIGAMQGYLFGRPDTLT